MAAAPQAADALIDENDLLKDFARTVPSRPQMPDEHRRFFEERLAMLASQPQVEHVFCKALASLFRGPKLLYSTMPHPNCGVRIEPVNPSSGFWHLTLPSSVTYDVGTFTTRSMRALGMQGVDVDDHMPVLGERPYLTTEASLTAPPCLLTGENGPEKVRGWPGGCIFPD